MKWKKAHRILALHVAQSNCIKQKNHDYYYLKKDRYKALWEHKKSLTNSVWRWGDKTKLKTIS